MPETKPLLQKRLRETGRHRRLFETWYLADRNFVAACRRWQENNPSEPAVPERTLRHWANAFGWHDRADDRDAEADAKAHREAVRRRADILSRHALIGKTLSSKGVAFYADKETKIRDVGEALAAIRLGVEIERKAEGMPEWLVRVMSMDDDQLIREYGRVVAQIGGPDGGDETAGGEPPDPDSEAAGDETDPEAEDRG